MIFDSKIFAFGSKIFKSFIIKPFLQPKSKIDLLLSLYLLINLGKSFNHLHHKRTHHIHCYDLHHNILYQDPSYKLVFNFSVYNLLIFFLKISHQNMSYQNLIIGLKILPFKKSSITTLISEIL